MKYIILLLVLSILGLAIVSAAPGCTLSISAKTVNNVFGELPTLNSQLQSCPVDIPSALRFVTKTGNVGVQVAMNDGTTSEFTFLTLNGEITGAQQGLTSYRLLLKTDENSFNAVLNSQAPVATITSLYQTRKITLSSPRFFTQFKLSVSRPFIRWFAPAAPAGKPDKCDDTWLPGHNGYAENKALWDSYSAQTTGVCQSMKPVSCQHNVQLSVSGTPYYLCWY